jgi:hypothetical protein
MNWRRLLVSRVSPTCWSLDEERVAVFNRQRKGPTTTHHQGMPDDLVEIGPVGLQSVDRERLVELLGPLHDSSGGERRAAVVIPTGWVRSHLLDFDDLPRKQGEIMDVVRWRLKKLLPVLPTELRMSLVRYPAVERRRALLCMVGLERAFTELEGAFTDIGVQPAWITPRLFALATAGEPATTQRLVIQQETRFLSLLLMIDKRPALLRTKLLPTSGDTWTVAARELHLALEFIRDQLEVAAPLQVVVAVEAELQEPLGQWCAEHPGVSTVTSTVPDLEEASIVSTLGAARLAPVHAMLNGGASS